MSERPAPLFDRLRKMSRGARRQFLRELTPEKRQALRWSWEARARAEQYPPDPWTLGWLIMSGRGWGKTRTGAETVRDLVASRSIRKIGLIGQTDSDAREVMVEGESGIMGVTPPDQRPIILPGKRKLIWPNGAEARWYSSKSPRRLRGPQHDFIWGDEPAHWANAEETHNNAMFGLRKGKNPRALYTTTPLPIQLMMDLVEDPLWFVTEGSTYDNQANLSRTFIQQNIARYEGTRTGEQEIYGRLLDSLPGALWDWSMILTNRVTVLPPMKLIVVAVDPSATYGPKADECGIVVVGLGVDEKAYVLDDRSERLPPADWGQRVRDLYDLWDANFIIAESNNGGQMVEDTIRQQSRFLPVRLVHAAQGKYARADPIAALYKRGDVKHWYRPPQSLIVKPKEVHPLGVLEDQMVTWTPDHQFGKSPDRVDALVWGVWALLVDRAKRPSGSLRTITGRARGKKGRRPKTRRVPSNMDPTRPE